MTTTGTEITRPAPAVAAELTLLEPQSRAVIDLGIEARPRDLITPGLFGKLTGRVIADGRFDQDVAERVVEQALAFLVACAHHPDGRLVPSRSVDAGWHAFILHTADYTEFCQRVAGRFIHHRPDNSGEAVLEQQAIGVTIAAMRDAGLSVDPGLWVPAAECSQCYQGCADDPRRA